MVAREDIQALADEIAAKFPEVERVILFGSHAYGTPGEWSDVDLMVLMPTDESRSAASLRICRAVTHRFARDILVYDPAVARRRYELWDPIIRHAFDGGQVLYERSERGHARLARERR